MMRNVCSQADCNSSKNYALEGLEQREMHTDSAKCLSFVRNYQKLKKIFDMIIHKC